MSNEVQEDAIKFLRHLQHILRKTYRSKIERPVYRDNDWDQCMNFYTCQRWLHSKLEYRDNSPVVYAREHAILMTEVEEIPSSSSSQWEHLVFKEEKFDDLICHRLRDAMVKGEVLVEIKAFV